MNNKELALYKNIDFYPLRTDCFWTGYFTSRPYLKGYIRKASTIYYSISKYHSMNKLINDNEYINDNITISNLNELRNVVALNQHHDAITGTSKTYVSDDFIQKIQNNVNNVETNLKKNIEKEFNIKIGKICYNNYIVNQNNCSNQFLISKNSKNDKIKIGLLNPSFSMGINKVLINIEILDSKLFYDVEGIKSDFFCVDEKNLNNIEYYNYDNKCFLNFFYEFKKGEDIGYIILKKLTKGKKKNDYYILDKINSKKSIKLINNKNDKVINIKSLIFYPKQLEFDLEYYSKKNLKKINFSYYDGMYYVNAGTCIDGAYLFSPYNKFPEKIDIDLKNSFYFKGNLGITFVTRNIDASFTFFTIYYNPFFIKVDHIFDNIEKSYFLRRFSFGYSFVLKTNINNIDSKNNKPIFYTDANGIEMIQRKVDIFPFKETTDYKVGGNFYPVTSSISIKDENNNDDDNIVSVFNDRPQAGTGLLPGSIALVIQRMSYLADNKGLDENLYEIESMNSYSFKTTHFIVFGLNFNNYDDDSNSFNLINFIYNYFNSATLLFNIKKDKEDFNNKIIEKNNLVNNKFNQYINISNNIRASYQFIHNNLIIGEYYSFNIELYNNKNSKNDENNYIFIKLNFPNEVKFKIFFDKTGINYNKRKNVLNSKQKEKLIVPKNQFFKLNTNEFLFKYFYFEN